MRIVTLIENTPGTKGLKEQHGLSLYIETKQHKLLFDCGGSGLLIENAQKLSVDLKAVDIVIISHGHADHCGGLKYFLEMNKNAKVYVREAAFDPHYANLLGLKLDVGIDASLKLHPQIQWTSESHHIDDSLHLFSGVTERACFPTCNKQLYMKKNNAIIQDAFDHEQNLLIQEGANTVLITGCSHSGIVNILNRAETLTSKPITTVIGGFHLYHPLSRKTESEDLLNTLADHLMTRKAQYYTGHCTGQKALYQLSNKMGKQISTFYTGHELILDDSSEKTL